MNDMIRQCENLCEQDSSREAPCKTHDHGLAEDSHEEQSSTTQALQEGPINEALESNGGWLTILTKFAKFISKVEVRNKGEDAFPTS